MLQALPDQAGEPTKAADLLAGFEAEIAMDGESNEADANEERT